MSKNSKLIEKYVFKYGKDFGRRGDALYCLVCIRNITVKSITVLLHVNSKSYKKRKSETKTETSSAKSTRCKSDYFFQLTEFLCVIVF